MSKLVELFRRTWSGLLAEKPTENAGSSFPGRVGPKLIADIAVVLLDEGVPLPPTTSIRPFARADEES